jgi:adenosylcobinamide-GDP ribazoletransferase
MSDGTAERKGSALRALVSFFTIKHFELVQADIDEMERKFHLVPVVGMIYGLLALVLLMAVVFVIENGNNGLWIIMIPVACMGCAYFGSRFLHFDGLTDFGDGTVVSGTREDHIRALKDTLVGAGGVGTAVAVVMIAFCSYFTIPYAYVLVAIPMSEVFLKVAMVFAAAYGEPSNGMAARQVSQTTKASAAKALVLGIILSAILMASGCLIADLWLGYDLETMLKYGVLALIAGAVAASAMGVIVARKANRDFGFVNGDVLGATNELSRPAVLIAMGLVLSLVPTIL